MDFMGDSELWGEMYVLLDAFLRLNRERESRERLGRIERAREEERRELACAREKVKREEEVKRAYEENRRRVEDADFFARLVERTDVVRHSTPPQEGALDYSVSRN